MAGNRIDMIERAAARLRRDAPKQSPTGPNAPVTSIITPTAAQLSPEQAFIAQPPVEADAAPIASNFLLVEPSKTDDSTPQKIAPAPDRRTPNSQSPDPVVTDPASTARVSLETVPPDTVIVDSTPVSPDPASKIISPPQEADAVPTGVKHSRTVVLDTARLALAGTIDWSSDRTPVMEELRLIKRRLLRRAFNSNNGKDSISHLVMVTSSKPREGKTFTSTNIAISISLEEDYNVLLVDADIRRQALRQNLGLEANQGFVDLLLNPDLDMADVLLRTNIPRLSVLPAGTMSDRAPELLASSRMRDLIDDMAQRYNDRIILFDTAPCLVSSDAATLAAHVGQVVFVIEAEQTQQHEIVAALNLISACPDIALVLNKAQPLATTSYGGYGAY